MTMETKFTKLKLEHYEFRIKEANKHWEDIKPTIESFDTWHQAVINARLLSKKHQKEVRINKLGSLQGHYFKEV